MKSYLEISDVGISLRRSRAASEALSRVNLRIEKGSSSPHRSLGLRQEHRPQPGGRAAGADPWGASFSMVARWRARGPSGLVFQNHALLPWLSVQQNVALAVAQVESDKRAVAERVDYYLSLVQMDHASRRCPRAVGG